MNFVTRKSLLMKLIISIFLVVFLFNTILVHYSYGASVIEIVGGTLAKPLFSVCGIILCGINGLLSLFLGGTDTFSDLMEQIKDKQDPQFRFITCKSRAYIFW